MPGEALVRSRRVPSGVIVKYLTYCGAPGRAEPGNAAHGRHLLKTKHCRRQCGFSRPPEAGFLPKKSFAGGKAVLPARRRRASFRKKALPEAKRFYLPAGGGLPSRNSLLSTPIGVCKGFGWNGGSTLNDTFRDLGWNKRGFFDKFLTKFLICSTPIGFFMGLGWNEGSTLNDTFQRLGWS